jgi:hypothetical protein
MANRAGPGQGRIEEVEALLALCDRERWAIIEALVRRIVAVQASADEAQLLAMIAYVEALLLGETRPPH